MTKPTKWPTSGPDPALAVSISAVERDTGLSKDTLRMWERRYGFPKPARDLLGERLYGRAEVHQLRLIKRLLDLGHRPGKLIGLELDALEQLASSTLPAAGKAARRRSAGSAGETTRPGPRHELDPYLELVKARDVEALRARLSQAILRLGLAGFVGQLVAALNEHIGDAWSRGELEIFEEHLYTEAVQGVLRGAIGAVAQAHRRPNVLLTTFPQEPHALGLLMAETIFVLEGCRCLSLGVQTPVWDIGLAASGRETDIVALSFTGTLSAAAVLAGLAQLRATLSPRIEVWTGGRCPVLQRRLPPEVRNFASLEEIAPALEQWRAAHGFAAQAVPT